MSIYKNNIMTKNLPQLHIRMSMLHLELFHSVYKKGLLYGNNNLCIRVLLYCVNTCLSSKNILLALLIHTILNLSVQKLLDIVY
jgi:hypothetical protein